MFSGAHFPRGCGRSKSAMDFISKCLLMDPAKRLTAEEALLHPWLRGDEASGDKIDDMLMESIKNFSAENKLKKVILEQLVEELDDDDTKLLQEQFRKLDTDGDAKVSLKELVKMIGSVKKASKIMSALDIDGDGEVAVDEFRLAFLDRKISSQQDRLFKIFNKMDLDGNGVVDRTEVYKALKGKIDKKDIEAAIKMRENKRQDVRKRDKIEEFCTRKAHVHQLATKMKDHLKETEQFTNLVTNQVDKDGNKKLDFAEFLSAWKLAEVERVSQREGITEDKARKCSVM